MAANRYTASDYIEAIQEAGGIIAAAARSLGVSRAAVYRATETYATVAAALEEARETTKDVAEAQLLKQIRAGNMTAIIFYLKTQAKERGYVERHEVAAEIYQAPEIIVERTVLASPEPPALEEAN